MTTALPFDTLYIKSLSTAVAAISRCVVWRSLNPRSTCLPRQIEQACPAIFFRTAIWYVCPCSHSHATNLPEPQLSAATVSGSTACSNNSGCSSATVLRLFFDLPLRHRFDGEHCGHPPFTDEFSRVCGATYHACCELLLHRQRSFLPERGVTPTASSGLTNVAAYSGYSVARSLTPGTALRPEQYGHPLPLRVREATLAYHVGCCGLSHDHSTFLCELADKVASPGCTSCAIKCGGIGRAITVLSRSS